MLVAMASTSITRRRCLGMLIDQHIRMLQEVVGSTGTLTVMDGASAPTSVGTSTTQAQELMGRNPGWAVGTRGSRSPAWTWLKIAKRWNFPERHADQTTESIV